MPSTADYCPFCGARLSTDEALDDHLDESDACASSFAAWEFGRSEADIGSGPEQVQQAVAWVLIGTVMLYALLIEGSVLLGVLASAVIYIAGRIDWAGVA